MSEIIRHTKTQANTYHKNIKDSVLNPLQKIIIDRLSQAAETSDSWKAALRQSFNDKGYLDSVDESSETLSKEHVQNLADWQKDKMRTQFNQLFGVDITPYLREPATQAKLIPVVDANIALIKSIPTELNQEVNEEYNKILMTDGFNQPKILHMLTERFSVANSRAALIASDQTGKTIGSLAHIRQTQVGVTHFVWVDSGDERVRLTHKALNGHIFLWAAPPTIGIPGQPIRCRCSARPYLPYLP